MLKLKSVMGALVIGAGLCSPSYGFEWLDQLIGIDLDNSEGATFYQDAQPTYSYSAGYAPYSVGYATPVNNGCNTCVPQATYRTYYQPVVTYRVQPQVVMPYTAAQPVYAPAPSYARPGCGCSGN
jgi:hypothetical protein